MLDLPISGGNVGIKFDIAKAFDTLDWGFLLQVLRQFGFSDRFVSWITAILHSAHLSISVNGVPHGYFPCSRGVRQGDPLSPLLFCLAEDVLSRGIERLVEIGEVLPISSPRGCKAPTHMMYADDIMVFCRGRQSTLVNLMGLFDEYATCSGQVVSKLKSQVFLGKEAKHRGMSISASLGIPIGQAPFTYLGVPIFRGKPRRVHLQGLADRAKAKMAGWVGKLISIAGRVQLVRAVVQPLLLHSFMVYRWPAILIRQLDTWMRNFVWSGDPQVKKPVTVAWRQLCAPYDAGGLGVRALGPLNRAGILRFVWTTIHTQSTWRDFMHARYGFSTKAKYRISSLWPGFKEAKAIIDLHARWIIGDGYGVWFWCSNWLGDSILDALHIEGDEHEFTSRVSDFITDGKWDIPAEFSVSFSFIADQIKKVPLPVRDTADVLIWPYTTTGELTFKDAYQFLQPTVPVSWARDLWASHIPPRISTLAWRLLHRRLPTQDLWQRYGWAMPSRCAICESSSEMIEHLFIWCPFAVQTWTAICGLFAVPVRAFDTVMEMWDFVYHRSFSPQRFQLWVAAVLYTWDFIWQARNKRIFQERQFTFHHFLTSLTGWLRMVSTVAKGHMGHSVEDLTIFSALGIPGRPRRAPLIIPIHWLPPLVGWVKLNTDGMAKGAPGRAAAGGVFRDYRGVVLGAFYMDIGVGTAFMAEISAVIQGIEYAHQHGWSTIWIELDSMAVIQCLQSASYRPPWRVATRWYNCKHLLSGMTVKYSHIYREGNAVADRLASMGLNHFDPVWCDSAPPQIQTLVGRDLSCLPTYRFRSH